MRKRSHRIFVAIVCAAALTSAGVACRAWWPRTEEHYFAIGAREKVVAPYPCRLRESKRLHGAGDVLTVEEWERDASGVAPLVFTAVAPGTARFACDGGTYVVHVRQAVSVALRGPTRARVGERFATTLVGVDAQGRDLEIGRYGQIDWNFDGALRADNPGSCEFPPWCSRPPAGASWVVATQVGFGHVKAQFGGLSAAASIEALSPSDGGTR